MTPKIFSRSVLGSILLALFFFASSATAQTTGSDVATHIWPGETWATSTPEAEGISADAIETLVSELESGVYGFVDAFMLIRNGKVVADHRFEQDYWAVMADHDTTNYIYNYDHPDWHPYLKGTELHSLQSVTKSVMSTVLGIAMDEGLIGGVDTPVMPYFEDYEPYTTDSRKESTTLADFLTMRSGIEWVTTGGYAGDEHDTIKMENSDEWIRYVLERPMDRDPGNRFQYNDGVSVLLGKIIREATGQRADEWARERLFEPIGINEFYWKITPDGEADTEGGLYLKTEDLARIGYLFLRGGEWDGKQIVSREWVESSTRPIIPDINPGNTRADPGYGYQWWILAQEGGEAKIFGGNGYGGQFVLVSPEHDIVVVFNGWGIHGGAQKSTYQALQRAILPFVDVDE